MQPPYPRVQCCVTAKSPRPQHSMVKPATHVRAVHKTADCSDAVICCRTNGRLDIENRGRGFHDAAPSAQRYNIELGAEDFHGNAVHCWLSTCTSVLRQPVKNENLIILRTRSRTRMLLNLVSVRASSDIVWAKSAARYIFRRILK